MYFCQAPGSQYRAEKPREKVRAQETQDVPWLHVCPCSAQSEVYIGLSPVSRVNTCFVIPVLTVDNYGISVHCKVTMVEKSAGNKYVILYCGVSEPWEISREKFISVIHRFLNTFCL